MGVPHSAHVFKFWSGVYWGGGAGGGGEKGCLIIPLAAKDCLHLLRLSGDTVG